VSTYLINTLGGSAGFGEHYLERNDDGSTTQIDIRSVFPDGLNFFGTVWNGIYINNNGNITFNSTQSAYTPTAITASTNRPIIAAFFADVDTRGTPGNVTLGGTSTGTNLMWYDLDPAAGAITVTWDDVGYYSSSVNKLNAFQLQLVRVGESDFDIVFRYEDINWTTGSASGGSGGLGGVVARAGYSSGDGANYFELPASGNQDAILNLENSSNVGQAGLWVFQVRNGAPVISLSVSDAVIDEGNGPGTTLMTFDVVLSSPTAAPVSVGYFTQPVTAGGADVVSQAGTVSFAPGQTRQTVAVEIVGDTTVEPNETFLLRLFDAVNATIGDDTGVGTIRNDDGLVVEDVSLNEGTGAGTTNATFTVRLLSAYAQPVSVDYSTAPVTASEGGDYAPVAGTLTFAPGETAKSVSVNLVRDTVVEADETFELRLSNPVNAQIADGTGVATIRNDDGFVVNDVSAAEGSGGGTTYFTFDVNLLSALPASSQVNYAIVGDTATAGVDFTAHSGMLTFSAGTTLAQVFVEIARDALVEADETFRVVLSNPTGTGIADGTGVGTIRNDDGISVNDATLLEGDSGSASMVFTVTLSSAASTAVSVNYATASGTALAGSDFDAASGTLNFAPGVSTQTVSVPIRGDVVPEWDETFTLQLSNPVGTGLVDGSGSGTIRNDDGLTVANPSNVTEGNTGTRTVNFTVTLNAASAVPVAVNYATADGTALAGSDYAATAGTLVFAPGETGKSVSVTVFGDTLFEPNETFRMVLTDPVNTRIVDGSATVSILNDDAAPPPQVNVSGVRQTEGSGAGTTPFRFWVSLSSAPAAAVSVDYATASGTATQGVDFVATSGTLVFAAGETLKEVVVPVVRDTAAEAQETFTLQLSNLVGTATLGAAAGTGTILNDDVSISVDDAAAFEGTGGARAANVVVRLSAPSPLPVSVDFATANGSAGATGDYQASTGTVTILPGQTVGTLSVPLVTDGERESDETFQVLLSNPVNGTIADGEAAVTIRNDDYPGPDVLVLGNENDDIDLNTGDDSLNAGGGNDRVRGGPGDDTIDGGDGVDTAVFAGPRSAYTITAMPDASLRVVDDTLVDGTDTLRNFERLEFSDVGLALDTAGNAGAMYGLWWALFDRDPTPSEFAHWVGVLDGGMVAEEAAALLLGAYVPGMANEDFVNIVYENVVGAPPTPAERSAFVSLIESGFYTQPALLVLAASLNGAEYAATIAGGIPYAVGKVTVEGTDGADTLSAAADPLALMLGAAGADSLAGSSAADLILGDAGNDTLAGGAGNDLYSGGSGTDVAVIAGTRAAHTLEVFGPSWLVSGPGGEIDTFSGIERVRFDDRSIALDTGRGEASGDALALWWALADRAPTPAEIGPWIANADATGSMAATAANMLATLAPGMSDPALVTLLYTNIVGAPPDVPTRDAFVGLIGPGRLFPTQADIFAYAADLDLARDQFVGLVGMGVEYLPQ